MSKKGKRYFGSEKKSNTSVFDHNDDDDERPDPKSRQFFYDDVDEFHSNKEKIHLDRARAVSPASSDEEVYKVRVDSDDDEEEADAQDADEKDDDMQSDIEEKTNEYLPSADAWGKKRKTFYSTDYVDKDYGGFSESDDEAAQLEEEEALSMQKRLALQMNEDDFRLEVPQVEVAADKQLKKPEVHEDEDDIDISKLSDEEKLQVLQVRNPELLSLIEEYKEKNEIIETQLKPIVDSLINGTLPTTKSLNFIRLRFEAYSNYLLNIHFYFFLKSSNISIKNHPVVDRIVEWKKVINDIDEKCENLGDDIKFLCEKLAKGEDVSLLNFIDSEQKSQGKIKFSSNTEPENEEEIDMDDREFYDFEDKTAGGDDDAKRAATYEMIKNKGTTPKRKKELRNPRVKNRMKFHKALHRKRSQVPDVKKELNKYGGEERGIKANVVKSVKLR